MSSIRNKTDSTTQKFQFYGGLVSRGIIILLTRFKGIQGHCTACTGYSESLLYKSCWVFGIRPTAHNKLDEIVCCVKLIKYRSKYQQGRAAALAVLKYQYQFFISI